MYKKEYGGEQGISIRQLFAVCAGIKDEVSSLSAELHSLCEEIRGKNKNEKQ